MSGSVEARADDARQSAFSVARRVARVQRRLPALQIVALVVLFIYGAGTIDGFSDGSSVRSMLVLAALLGIASIGQTLVVILGGIDLSISGYIVGGAIGVSQLYGVDHWSPVVAIVAVVAACGAMGAATGYICQRYAIQPLVATLGAGSIAAGIVVAWTQGEFAEQAPPFLGSLTSVTGRTFGLALPPVVAIWILAAIVIAVVLHRTVPGRRLYAAGANPLAASLALVRVRRVWIAVFAASAICSALAGVLLAGFAGANQSLGDPYLWEGLTAVVVGGTAVGGARGDYTHTAIGALILTVLSTILIGKGLSPADEQIVFGVLILIVVAGYGRERHLRDRI